MSDMAEIKGAVVAQDSFRVCVDREAPGKGRRWFTWEEYAAAGGKEKPKQDA